MRKAALLVFFLATAVLLLGEDIRSAGPVSADPGITPGVSAGALAAAMDIPAGDIALADLGTSDIQGEGVGDSALAGFPTTGATFAILASGLAASADDPDANNGEVVSGGGFADDVSAQLGGLDNSQGNDLVQLTLQLDVPAEFNCLTFRFAFFSEEWPDYYLSSYNDTFIAEIGAPGAASTFSIVGNDVVAPNNFAFDPLGDALDVNSGFGFNPADPNPDTGTTYDGTSGLLSASTPVTGGSTIEVVFSIMDLGDSILDSAVFIDGVQWGALSGPECEPGAQAVCDESPISPALVEEVIFPGQSADIEKCVEVPVVPPVPDVFFLFDTTGSMGDDIATVQLKLADIITQVQAVSSDPQFGVANYEDFPFDPWGLNVNVAYDLKQAITGNTAAVTAAINALSTFPGSGNDTPESGYEGLYQALTGAGRDLPDAAGGAPDGDYLDPGEVAPGGGAGFRPTASKVIMLIGDAAFHDAGDPPVSLQFAAGYPGASEADVMAAQGDVTIVCLVPGTLEGVGPSSQCADLGAPTFTIGDASEDIVEAILEALGEVEVEVEMQSDCTGYITTSFDPATQTVTSGEVVHFTETISVAADTPGGTYACRDWVTIDGQPLVDAAGNIVYEHKVIKVPEGFLTGGGQIDTGNKKTSKKVDASGNVGFLADASLVGQWNIQFHNVAGTSLDGAHFHSSEILALQFFNDGGAGPNPPPANANIGVFAASGSLNGVDGYTVIVCLADRGEPGMQNDSIRIILLNPAFAVIYDSFASGDFASQDNTLDVPCANRHKLDGGNYQIHSGLKD